MSDVEKDPFEGMEEQKVQYNNLKFGKPGDWIRGTLVDNTRKIKNQLSKDGEMQTVIQIKASGGRFHNIEKKQVASSPTEINPGEFWSFITGKQTILNQLKNAKLGQIIGLRFAEIKEATKPGFDDTKIIKVLLGEMDPEYQGETQGD